jgi:WD40 repeat protein
MLLYLNGEQRHIPLDTTKDKVLSHPRFSADGTAIYYAQEELSSNIWQLGIDQRKITLTENTALNYAAVFSTQGDKIVYASVRNNQIHLWLIENGQERQLTNTPKNKKVHSIIWANNDEHLLYREGTDIFHFDMNTATEHILLEQADKTDPVAFYPDKNLMLVIKQTGEARNLWRINIATQEQKQLTFGSLGSAIEFAGDIYFQYTDKRGLWVLRSASDTLEQLGNTLEANSQLLKADSEGIYLISGGKCRESDVYHLDFNSSVVSTYLERQEKAVSTTSFHLAQGLLQTDCVLTESNILRLE